MTRAGRTGDDQRPPAGTVPPLSSYPRCAVYQQSGRYRNRDPGSKKRNERNEWRRATVNRRMQAGRETAAHERIELLGLPPDRARAALGDMLREWEEPRYRVDQVLDWAWKRRSISFAEMTDLPSGLRDRLALTFSLDSASCSYEARSEDGTIKHLWRLSDGQQVDSVLIPSADRVTLCLSSQAGCALG
ncbi:MAG: hypothetical protein ACWGON_08635, partial [Gemmatimonadota bacterium]